MEGQTVLSWNVSRAPTAYTRLLNSAFNLRVLNVSHVTAELGVVVGNMLLPDAVK